MDLTAGGTWLGVNRFGVVVTVTNRPKKRVPSEPTSRGLLCRGLLAHRSAETAEAALWDRLASDRFAGCNVAVLSQRRAVIVEAGDTNAVHELEPGIHAITNDGLNDESDCRLGRALAEFRRMADSSLELEEWLAGARRNCALRSDANGPALCIVGGTWGTVSSTVLALPDDPLQAHYFFSPGPPSSVAYEDYSKSLRVLLAG